MTRIPNSLRRSAILLIISGLALGACRGSAAEPTIPPPQATTTTSTVSTTTLAPTTTNTSTTVTSVVEVFPVTVETDLGPVDIEAEPERIVSLSATHTEMLYAVDAGASVVATDLTSNYPVAALDTVKLDSFNFNVEEVAALEPDLVIIAFDFQGEAAALATLEIPFLLLGPPATFADALIQLENVGRATGRGGEATQLAAALRAEVDEMIVASAPIRGVTIFHEVDETLYSATSGSFIGDIYAQLGLVNIADAAGLEGAFPQLSAEYIVDQDPEFIFLADANFGVSPQSVAARPGWDTIRAVINGRVVALDGDLAGRWGPRTVELMRSIFEVVESEVP